MHHCCGEALTTWISSNSTRFLAHVFYCVTAVVKHRQADTKDHSILVSCFSTSFGLSNSVLSWFHSCLSSCTQTLSVSGSKSLPAVLQFGIPQGKCSFIVYTHPHSAVVSHHSLFPRSFSDGSWLYVSAHLSQLYVSAISALCLSHLSQLYVSAISVNFMSWPILVSFMSQPSQSALCLSHLSQLYVSAYLSQLYVSAISVSFMSQPSQLYVSAISVSFMSQPSQSALCLSHLSQLYVSAISALCLSHLSQLYVSAHLSQLYVSAISALCLSHLSQLYVSAISVSFMSQPSQSALCLSHLTQLYVSAISALCLSHLSQLYVSAISVSFMSQPSQSAPGEVLPPMLTFPMCRLGCTTSNCSYTLTRWKSFSSL